MGCFRQQRYKFLKAIHNISQQGLAIVSVVSDNKDTNFWKQFTTLQPRDFYTPLLFQTTKIQIFESNSQLSAKMNEDGKSCFRQQRYKFLKAIHNGQTTVLMFGAVVSDNKDTNFWKQFTTFRSKTYFV